MRAFQLLKRHVTAWKIRQARRQARIFSGLLKCGACGGGMASFGHDRKGAWLQCSSVRESGTCTSSRKIYRPAVEAAALDGLRRALSIRRQTSICADFCRVDTLEKTIRNGSLKVARTNDKNVRKLTASLANFVSQLGVFGVALLAR
jgi:recombinase-like zinc beta ribbon protein